MIVRNKHQTAELIRKGRRVDYVYRGGKRVFGVEPIPELHLTSFSATQFSNYSSTYKGIVKSSFFSKNVISNIVDVTMYEPFKVYLYVTLINEYYYLNITSPYLGASTILVPHNLTSAFNYIQCPFDCSIFDYRECVNMSGFLQGNKAEISNLEAINFSNKTDRITSLVSETAIQEFYLPNADFSKIRTAIYTFGGCRQLIKLDLSNADFSTLTSVSNFMVNTVALQIIKTPARSAQVDITLPATFYNEDGSVYGNVIPANTVGSVTIYRTLPTT